MADLHALTTELRTQHTALTEAFETAQAAAEIAWADAETKAAALVAFRNDYGAVLKALDQGAVTVKE